MELGADGREWRYKLLLCDADGTLFDFHRGERVAVSAAFACFGIPATEENLTIYRLVNQEQWRKLEQGETTQERLRVDRFAEFLRQTGLHADVLALSQRFTDELARQRFPLPGARAFLARVSAAMPVLLVTNGIAKVQRGRFTDCELSPYLSGMVISEEIGHAKPHPAMVEEALRMAGVSDRREALLMGDSISADIGAALNAGVDSLLFTNGAPPPENHGATYVARTFEEALPVVLQKANGEREKN